MFDSSFFKGNRTRLASKLPGQLVVVAANSLVQSTADVHFPFRQDSNFWYLTGIDEPDLVLAIDTETGESVLFSDKQSEIQKQWDGEVDYKEMIKSSSIEQHKFLSELPKFLKNAKKRGIKISHLEPLEELVSHYGFYSNPASRRLLKLIKKVEPKPKDVRLEIAKLRQIKQPCEIEQMQKAIDITAQTLESVKKKLAEYVSEKELTQAITVGFYANGADGHGYEPIVATGKNAATIHYTKNDSKLKNGELVLLDVGAITGYYSADISRTWSVGKPSERQKAVHSAVLELQKQAFSILKPGVLLLDYQRTMEKHAKNAMKKLGVKPKKYPHGFSHFIGLDVHDAGDYEAPLKENTLITVEPGIYLSDEGIGVRIEDIVRITKSGVEILSDSIPRLL